MSGVHNILIPARSGATVVHHNQWRGFSCPDIAACFENVPFGEVESLQPGDLIWVDTDPLSPHGKVYGWVLRRVKQVSRRSNGLWIDHSGGGFIIREDYMRHKVQRVKDPERLAELLAQHGDNARKISVH